MRFSGELGERGSEQLLYHLAAIDDLQGPALRAQVLLARIDLQRVTEGTEEIRHRHRAIAHRRAVGSRGAEDLSALDAGARQRQVERAREVIPARVAVDARRA